MLIACLEPESASVRSRDAAGTQQGSLLTELSEYRPANGAVHPHERDAALGDYLATWGVRRQLRLYAAVGGCRFIMRIRSVTARRPSHATPTYKQLYSFAIDE